MTEVGDIHTDNTQLLDLNPELRKILGSGSGPAKVSKYRNVRNRDPDGESYDSGKEAADARKFTLAVRAGEYILYKHHVTIPLPGDQTIIVDHFLVNRKLQVEIFDSKSADGKATVTRVWINKKKLFEATYHIEIKTI